MFAALQLRFRNLNRPGVCIDSCPSAGALLRVIAAGCCEPYSGFNSTSEHWCIFHFISRTPFSDRRALAVRVGWEDLVAGGGRQGVVQRIIVQCLVGLSKLQYPPDDVVRCDTCDDSCNENKGAGGAGVGGGFNRPTCSLKRWLKLF